MSRSEPRFGFCVPLFANPGAAFFRTPASRGLDPAAAVDACVEGRPVEKWDRLVGRVAAPQVGAELVPQPVGLELQLRRNARAYGVHFAVDAQGDVFLVGARAAAGLDVDELDRIVGSILIEADGMFNAAIEIGFKSYL